MNNKGGTIRTLKNGKYQWVGYLKDENGKEKRPTRCFDTYEEAEDFLILQQKTSSVINNTKNLKDYTVSQFYEYWKNKYWQDEKTYSYNTTRNWNSIYNKHILPFIGNYKIDNIKWNFLQEHFDNTDLSSKTYKNILQAITAMLEKAKEERVLAKYEVDIIIGSQKKKPDFDVFNFLSENDYNAIFSNLINRGSYYAYAIAFLRETGLRAEELAFYENEVVMWNGVRKGELLGYVPIRRSIKRHKDTDTGKSSLYVSEYLKNSSSYRYIPLSHRACMMIERQREYKKQHNIKSDFVFCTTIGTLLEYRNVLRAFHKAIDYVNEERKQQTEQPRLIKKRGLHSLRKLFCKCAAENLELDGLMISRIVGHTIKNITEKVYIKRDEMSMFDIAKEINLKDVRIQEDFYRMENPDLDGFNLIPMPDGNGGFDFGYFPINGMFPDGSIILDGSFSFDTE